MRAATQLNFRANYGCLAKEYSKNYHVCLFEYGQTHKDEISTSSQYLSKAKAEGFAENWMLKHLNSMI
jgi:hypothetical protein